MKMSLYSVSMWAMRPSARLSMSARMPSIDQVLGAGVAGGASTSSARTRTRRRTAFEARQRQQGQTAISPTAPSVSVIAREPIVGMSKNVVPSVPTIEPAVETP